MRFPRVKAEGQSFYHCVSRVVDRQFIFQTGGHSSAEAERFVQLMRRLEAFSGVPVLTYGKQGTGQISGVGTPTSNRDLGKHGSADRLDREVSVPTVRRDEPPAANKGQVKCRGCGPNL